MRVLNRLLQRLVVLGLGIFSVWLIQRMPRQQTGALPTRGRVSVKHQRARGHRCRAAQFTPDFQPDEGGRGLCANDRIGTGLTLAVLPHCWDERTFVQTCATTELVKACWMPAAAERSRGTSGRRSTSLKGGNRGTPC